MKKIYLGQEFINTALSSVEMKKRLSSTTVMRYLMRAAMSGAIIISVYVAYMGIISSFNANELPAFGKFIGASFFTMAIIAIYFTKSELFTSNIMILSVGRYYKAIKTLEFSKILLLCLLGNFLGSFILSALLASSTIVTPEIETVLGSMMNTKQGYIANGAYWDLFVRAIFCNFFINIAMLIVYSGNVTSEFGKCIAMYFGVFIFVFLGLEHSVANAALFSLAFWVDVFNGTSYLVLNEAVLNVVIAVAGNLVGGGLLIGMYYAFINDSGTSPVVSNKE